FICFPKLRFSDQRKTPQWQTGLCPNNMNKKPPRPLSAFGVFLFLQNCHSYIMSELHCNSHTIVLK
ncbi:hypothetical protein, partial [Blautia wexlerae]|uniref:hypothetical protein n=1 Tax=Blautia wexlerae TaxID=418240 RepID=UPI0032191271